MKYLAQIKMFKKFPLSRNILFLALTFLCFSCSKLKFYQDYLQRTNKDKCSGIVDIYYNRARSPDYVKALETSQRGHHYVTLTACDNCITSFVKRDHYDEWAQSYKDQGIEPPHPRRTDTNGLICHLYGGKRYKFTGYNYIYPPVE